jgi:hypothetical protein
LSSSNTTTATTPASISITTPASVSPPFTIATKAVTAPKQVTISATYGSVTKTATLTVYPAVLYGLLIQPSSVGGGLPARLNAVSLAGNAPPGGAIVSLSSSNPSIASVPATVTIPADASLSPNFTINTAGVSVATQVTITASYSGLTKTATLTVTPPVLFALAPAAATVGSGATLSGNLVSLNGVAPAGGVTVQLVSSKPAVLAAPASVFIPAGSAYSQAFSLTARTVSTATPVIISATWNGTTVQAPVTVNP